MKVPYAKKWQKETNKLRQIAQGCHLTEELKWGKPCFINALTAEVGTGLRVSDLQASWTTSCLPVIRPQTKVYALVKSYIRCFGMDKKRSKNGSLLPSGNRVHFPKDLLKEPAADGHPAGSINVEMAASWEIRESGANTNLS